MAQYIDKDKIITEIDNRITKYTLLQQKPEMSDLQQELQYKIDCLNSIKGYILNTLEVKEVDLEKSIGYYISSNFFGSQTMGFFANRTNEEPNDQDIALCAKHFFELGLKCKSSHIDISNIDDTLKEMGIDPDSKEANSFKNSYYIALEKFKEEKGI